jgi:hypothetical protein
MHDECMGNEWGMPVSAQRYPKQTSYSTWHVFFHVFISQGTSLAKTWIVFLFLFRFRHKFLAGESMGNPRGIHGESMGNPWGIHGESMGNPWGIHGESMGNP